MYEALKTGVLLGLTLSVLIGPVFFALLQTSIYKGFFAAAIFALGIALSDSIYILITNFFIAQVENIPQVEFFLGIFGGILLIFIGIQTFVKKPVSNNNDVQTSGAKKAALFIKGFLLNFAHPGVLLFWVGIVSLISTQGKYTTDEKFTLYSVTVLTVFIIDLLKSFTANKLSRFLTLKFLLWMNRIMGIALTIFGIHLFVSTLLK